MDSRRRITAIVILGTALLLGACRKAQRSPESQPDAPAPIAAAPAVTAQPAGGPAATSQTKFFKGSIGDGLGLQMKLVRDGELLTGSYFYQKVGSKIGLKGTVDKTGNVTLDEYDNSGKPSGSFKGLWRTDNEDGLDRIAGNWFKPNSDKKTAFSLHEEPIAFTIGTEIVAKQIKENNKKLNYKIEAAYPEIVAPLDNRFSKFNQEAKNLVTRSIADFKKERAETAKADAEATEPPVTSEIASDLTADYTIAFANDTLISIEYNIGGYSAGAAHGSASSHAQNYDVKAGKMLKLGDLFRPGAKYVQAISVFCISDLKKQSRRNNDILPDDMIQEGAGASAENFASWTISRKGLHVTFDEYRVGPYVAGPQQVLIPYAILKDLINPDGPLAQFSK